MNKKTLQKKIATVEEELDDTDRDDGWHYKLIDDTGRDDGWHCKPRVFT